MNALSDAVLQLYSPWGIGAWLLASPFPSCVAFSILHLHFRLVILFFDVTLGGCCRGSSQLRLQLQPQYQGARDLTQFFTLSLDQTQALDPPRRLLLQRSPRDTSSDTIETPAAN